MERDQLMKYSMYIAQEFFALWGKYEVTNAAGQMMYRVQGHPAFLRSQSVYNSQGTEVGNIKQQFSILPKFDIAINGRTAGTISSQFRFFHPALDMNYFHWSVEGNFFGWNYDVYDRAHHRIAEIRTELWHLTDHYAIHYEYEKDALPLLLLALAIDCIQDANRSASS